MDMIFDIEFLSIKRETIQGRPHMILGDSVKVECDPNFRSRQFTQCKRVDDKIVLTNNNKTGYTLYGGGIEITSTYEIKMLYLETYVAVIGDSVTEKNDMGESKLSVAIMGESCPEYYTQSKFEIFKMIIQVDDEVYDITLRKNGSHSIHPKGTIDEWEQEDGNKRYINLHNKQDSIYRDHGSMFKEHEELRDRIYVCDSDVAPEEIAVQFNLKHADLGELSSRILPLEIVINEFENDNSTYNPKDLVVVGESYSDVWRIRRELDDIITQYYLRK